MTAAAEPEEETTADRRERYERVCRIVEHQTGGPQPPGIREPHILGTACRARLSPDEVETALRAAVEQGDLMRWRDEEGRPRYAIPGPDAVRAALDAVTEAAIQAAAEAEIEERDEPRQQVVGACNQLLAEVRSDDD